MVEGRVAVLTQEASGSGPEVDSKSNGESPVELSAGQALSVRADGASTVLPKADIEAAMAWRQGKSHLSRPNANRGGASLESLLAPTSCHR